MATNPADLIDPKTGKKKITPTPINFEETLKTMGGELANVLKRIGTEGITGARGEMLQAPTETPILPGLGAEVKERAGTSEDLITELGAGLETAKGTETLTEAKKRLGEEKGILGMETTVGSFEDEVTKTQTLLDTLEKDITARTKEYLVSEPQRKRILAAEQAPLMQQLGIAERGLTGATGRLERTQQDILTELGLIEKEKTAPLDLLEREVNIRTKIKDLTTKDIPNVTTSQFNDEGDLTIVTQDPTTGIFDTQTLEGIGKKASEYEQFSTIQNAAGDVTVIGIKRDGTTQNLGVFKGAGKTTITDQARVDTVTTYLDSVKNDQGKVSPDDYISAQRNWISGGGNITDFKSAFPTDMIQEEQFLNTDWITKTYGTALEGIVKKEYGLEKLTPGELKTKAKEEGFHAGGFLGVGTGEEGVKKYLESLKTEYIDSVMRSIEAWRQAGKSDKEIIAEMMK